MSKPFSVKRLVKSFGYAVSGLKILMQEEHNAWVHLTAAILAIVISIILDVSTAEQALVFLAIGMVFALEILNTAIENLSDVVSPEKNQKIERIKDLAAAGVLVASLTAASIGCLVFIPKLITMFVT